jgi:hypothetical protein
MRIAYGKLALHTKTESNAGSKFVAWEDAAIRTGARHPTCIAVSRYGGPCRRSMHSAPCRRPAAPPGVCRSADR